MLIRIYMSTEDLYLYLFRSLWRAHIGVPMPKLKEILRRGDISVGTWITIGHPDVVEALSTLPPTGWFLIWSTPP